jgi:hypothetical protein
VLLFQLLAGIFDVGSMTMRDWFVPLFSGAIVYVLGTARSRLFTGGKPLDGFSRALRAYATVGTVGEGYLILTIGTLVDEKLATL